MKEEVNKMQDNDMRAEYNFTGGVRGKRYRAMQAGYTITIHEADGTTVVKEVLPKKVRLFQRQTFRRIFLTRNP